MTWVVWRQADVGIVFEVKMRVFAPDLSRNQ